MDLAISTGRGPDILTNIDGLKPYVQDEHVIHIGQEMLLTPRNMDRWILETRQ